LVLTCAPVAVKVLLVCPEATVTLEGTVRLALLLESDTANPPPVAAAVNPTVQEVLPGVLMVELVQLRLLSAVVTGREIDPDPPLEDIEVPPALVATTLVS
jgi:sulfur carrier protein ThiS